MTNLRILILALACTLAGLTGGIWLGGHPERLPDGVRDALVDDFLATRAEIIDKVSADFFEEVDEESLREASLKGIVESLDDRFSAYFTPKEAETIAQSLSGAFDGVGMTVDEDKRGLVVVSVFDGSPADRSGLRPEDIITAVNGRSIAGVPSDVATAKIKGPSGTKVRLTVLKKKGAKKRTLTIVRERIEVPITDGRLETVNGVKLGVAQLATFSSGAHGQLRDEIDGLLKKGAKGIVLDLRNNGGGLLQEGVLVASIFVPEGETVVSTDGRSRPKRVLDATGDPIDADIPVSVLVNRGTASASEIVAGALRDQKRATIVGTRTFGKGVFQELESLANGGALDITVGRYFLPSGENISDKGIQPTVRAKDDPDTREDEGAETALRALSAKVK
ncbi:MAG TPA: S41 family peptidase [Thermoleophilaceae bacterium]|nr:S41 family peptidase [Thermoleophilaceae bacterium]